MVLGRITAEKDQLHRPQVALVGLEEAQHALVVGGHARQVAHVEAMWLKLSAPGRFSSEVIAVSSVKNVPA